MAARTDWNPDLADPQIESDDGPQPRARQARAGSQDGTGSWQDIKSRFVDDPKGALAAAEQLVQRAVEDRVRALQDEASAICARDADEDDDGSTEALRTRLIRYQQYCEQLAGSAPH